MYVNYLTVSRQLAVDFFRTYMEESEDWRDEFYQDYVGPINVHDDAGNRKGLTGTYGFIPKRHLPPGQRLTTKNSRAETVGQLRTYKSAWNRSALPWPYGPLLRTKLGATDAHALVRWDGQQRAVRRRRPLSRMGRREWKEVVLFHPADHQRR